MSKLVGSIMIGVGLLIAGLSGLCSVAFGVMLLGSSGVDAKVILQWLGAVAVFGGIPFAIGLGLFFGGRSVVRKAEGANAHSHVDDPL
jgi:hypothetical protein